MRQCGSILDKNIRGMVLYFPSLLQLHPMQQLDYLTFNAGSYVAYDSLIDDYVTFGCVIETFKLKIFSIFNNGISIIQDKLGGCPRTNMSVSGYQYIVLFSL